MVCISTSHKVTIINSIPTVAVRMSDLFEMTVWKVEPNRQTIKVVKVEVF